MADDDTSTDILPVTAGGDARRRGMTKQPEVTLHQLRIFWAVAHSETLTKAAKQLGLAQPSLSQQLSKLESTVGTLLFHRRSNEMTLTEAGSYLLPKAEHVMRSMRELEDGLQQFSAGQRVTIRLAGINSMLRVLLPTAIAQLHDQFPDADYDIQESAPADILELLYGRRVNVGLLAANSVAQSGVGFVQVPVIDDPYVFVVPQSLDLDKVALPARDLDAASFALLNQAIQFTFGTQHSNRIEDWYGEMLPDHRVIAHCRSFDVAIGMVRAGSGVCIAPALSAMAGPGALEGVRLYRINVPARRLVALVPSQYRRMQPYASLLEALQGVGAGFELPPIGPVPPFLDRPSLPLA